MAGDPRLEGHRITVLTAVNFVEDFGGINEAAQELRIEPEEVREALEYAREHPEEMDELREEWDELQSATADRADWTGTTPDDAGEALFGHMDTHLNENQDADEF